MRRAWDGDGAWRDQDRPPPARLPPADDGDPCERLLAAAAAKPRGDDRGHGSGHRSGHGSALAVQARRTLKQKLSQLKDQRQKIAKKSIARRDERKALGAKIKAAFQVSKNSTGDAEALLRAAEDLPDDDDDDNWADEDVEMAMD